MAAVSNASANSRNEPLKCKSCNKKLPDIYAYVDHLESKDHKKGVMKSIMKNKYGKKILEARAIREGEETIDTESKDDEEVYTCNVCQKMYIGLLKYNLHLSGQKHQKKLNIYGGIPDKVIPENNDSADGDQLVTECAYNESVYSRDEPRECKECGILFHDIYAYADHLEGKEHVKGVLKNKYGKEYVEEKAVIDGEKTKDIGSEQERNITEYGAVYSCDVCPNTICTGKINYDNHLQGKKHKKYLQRCNYSAV